jgi:hypothetical protein
MQFQKCFAVCILLASFLIALPGVALAVQIQPTDFSPNVFIEDFDDLGLIGSPSTPLFIGADVYSTNNGLARYLAGSVLGRTGRALGTQDEMHSMDIQLGVPAYRAGLYVGLNVPWTIDVSFYDIDDVLMTTMRFSGAPMEGKFAGWQTESQRIGRIRVTDPVADGFIIAFDDFYQEVPEPSAIAQLGAMLLLMGAHWPGRYGR